MAKLLCAFVLAALVFQVSAFPWQPSHWMPDIEWFSKLNPFNWFGGCNRCELQGVTGPCRGNETPAINTEIHTEYRGIEATCTNFKRIFIYYL
ncbi:hypothetical protein TNIN_335851 [Trichonephila inaurata madagascariensis]|uniref:Uncharacterized protein n=1 Tax=Trichonephila inaurata madagascariensis TaxID=2747483 RepID=A0A8X6Y316_9ARAC|nr:hypothetical protein TNIN_335851 [Trichonephila inaurata madagascariensis]